MRTKAEIFNELAPLLGEYLEAYGWTALVVGEKGVAQAQGKYRFDLIFSFTGKKKSKETPDEH